MRDNNDPLWQRIYHGIRCEYYGTTDHLHPISRRDMERRLAELGIAVHKHPADGHWVGVELPQGGALTVLALRYT